MSEWSEEQVQETIQAINKKAMVDEDFHKLCLSDPGAAVKEVTGQELPEGFNLRIVDNENAHYTHVLPDVQKDGELSDDQLEEVAGGTVVATITAGTAIATAVEGSK